MKKFDYKKLLVLALALVLVFALVACGGNTPTDEPPVENPTVTLKAEDYFTALWNASKSIGSTAIPSTSDMNFELGLDVDLAVMQGTATAVEYKLGIDIKAIYDRKNSESDVDVGKYSAAMLTLVDRDNNANIVSLYYYLDEPTNIYAQMGEEKVVFAFNADNGDGTAANQSVFSNLTKFLTKSIVSEDNTFINGKSMDDIILQFTNSFGPDFDLDDIVAVLLNMMGMDMGELINAVQTMIDFDVADENNASLLDVLNGLGGVAIGNIKKTTANNKVTWSGTLNSVVKLLASGLTDNLINDTNTTISLSFNTDTDGSNLDDLSIGLVRKNILSNTSLNATITIDTLKASATTAAASGTGSVFGMTKSEFKTNHQISLDATVSVADAMVQLTYADSDFAAIEDLYTDDNATIAELDSTAIQGVFRIEADGMINLSKNDSATTAYARVFYKDNTVGAQEKLVVEASFDNDVGVGTAKIWMDETDPYAVIARDYLILNVVKAMHNTNTVNAVDPQNPTRQELIAGSNGAVIVSLLGALNSDADTYYVTGIELQTMLWDLFFVDDGPSVEEDDANVIASVTTSSFPWKVNFLSVAKTILGVVSQSESNAFAFTLNGIANSILKENIKTDGTISAFGIFDTLYGTSNNGIIYNSFENIDDIYAWFYKGDENVIKRMTDAGIIAAVKLEVSASGKYMYNDNGDLVLITATTTVPSGTTRYNLVKATTLADNALVGQGTWFYQNSTTLDKDETRKMWAAATGTWTYGSENTAVETIEATALSTEQKTSIYEDCIEYNLITFLADSTFIGGAVSNADNGAWIDNILAGSVDFSVSYISENGITFNVSFEDVAENVASISLTLNIKGLDTPYTYVATNLGFDDSTADCVIDVSAYMDQIRADYEAQIAE